MGHNTRLASPQNILLVGSGNVAHIFSRYFSIYQGLILYIFGRNKETSLKLANTTGSRYLGQLKEAAGVNFSAIVLCVSDQAIHSVSSVMEQEFPNTLQIHTSGTQSISVLVSSKKAVLYPLMSLSQTANYDRVTIPLLLETNQSDLKSRVENLARAISTSRIWVSSEQRSQYHLAAVFGSNFTQLLFQMVDEITERESLDKSVLFPLFTQTVEMYTKGEIAAKLLQTGPAKRGDQNTIDHHIEKLQWSPEITKIYSLLTEAIRTRHKKHTT